MKTSEWAAAHGICVEDVVPSAPVLEELGRRAADEVAKRALVLHGVVAVAYGVEVEPVVNWFKQEKIWPHVSPKETLFLDGRKPTDEEIGSARWRQEAQWALLWAIGKVDFLGLPIGTCDTAKLVDKIMPALGESVVGFVKSAKMRSPEELLAEDDRVYNLHCLAVKAYWEGKMPEDLVYGVLFQRRYALEWLGGDEGWDEVETDT